MQVTSPLCVCCGQPWQNGEDHSTYLWWLGSSSKGNPMNHLTLWLSIDDDFIRLGGTMVWVWDGSHRLTTWRLRIDRRHRNDPNLLYYVDCIFLDPMGSIGVLLNAMHNVNLVKSMCCLVSSWCYSSLICPKLIELWFPLVIHDTIAFVGPLKATMWRHTTFTYCIVWRCLVSLSCKTIWGFLSKDHYPSC